jgi:hypothetical protein
MIKLPVTGKVCLDIKLFSANILPACGILKSIRDFPMQIFLELKPSQINNLLLLNVTWKIEMNRKTALAYRIIG